MKKSAQALKRVHVIYSGTVQGVGFRFTVQSAAQGTGICGWVKNAPNGTVEMVAEGTHDALEACLAQINSSFKQYIHDTRIEWEAPQGEFRDFTIVF